MAAPEAKPGKTILPGRPVQNQTVYEAAAESVTLEHSTEGKSGVSKASVRATLVQQTVPQPLLTLSSLRGRPRKQKTIKWTSLPPAELKG